MSAVNARRQGDKILAELIEADSRVEPLALLPLLPLLGELAAGQCKPATAGTVRRALGRWRLLKRFSVLKRRHPARSNSQIMNQVNREAARIAPGLRCSVRSLESWLRGFNSVGPGGLAAGPAALIDKYRPGRPPKKRDSNAV